VKLNSVDGRTFYHSVRDDFKDVLKDHIAGSKSAIVGLGPIYDLDPAAATLSPFYRSAQEVGIDPAPEWLAPKWALDRAHDERIDRIISWLTKASEQDRIDAVDWTRAGLVLEISAWHGITLRSGAVIRPRWKLRGTVTGRFGIENGSGFNPLTIPKEHRARIVPSGDDRVLVVQDFRAMDLCSILSLFPDLVDRYSGSDDLHARTADLVGVDREVAKKELFTFAYGGHSASHREFSAALPELVSARGPDLARKVQETSAKAFKAALSNALPLLFGGLVRPVFTVHDELVLDVDRKELEAARQVAEALAYGASKRIGVPYSVDMKVGTSYAEAKE
jgi:hypothetical protein